MTTCLIGLALVASRRVFGITPTPVGDLPPPHATTPAAAAINAKLSAAARGRKVSYSVSTGKPEGF
jgi:hypothetical protein